MFKYTLLKSQKKFLEIPHNHKLDVCVYQGGFGSGKTFAGSLLCVLLCLKYPKITGLVGAKTYSLVRDTTLVSYFEHLEKLGFVEGKNFVFNKGQQKLIFKNGSSVLFRHFDEPNRLKSLNLGFAEIEEMSDVPEETFKMLLGRMRQAREPNWKNFQYRIFGHTNPENKGGWIYKTFVQNKKENYRFIIAPTTENSFLPPEYCEELKHAYDEKYYKMNVLGEFADNDDRLIVKNFDSRNLLELNYSENADLHITCDFNVDPMCWELAHVINENVYFFDEIALENTTTEGACKYFLEKYGKHKGKIIINGDASGDNRSPQSEWTNYIIIRKTLSGAGFKNIEFHIRNFNPPIKNRIHAFNAKVCNFNGEKSLFIDPKCKKLLYNINNLKYREGTCIIDLPTYHQIKTSNDKKFLGHPFDAASYLVEYYFPIDWKEEYERFYGVFAMHFNNFDFSFAE